MVRRLSKSNLLFRLEQEEQEKEIMRIMMKIIVIMKKKDPEQGKRTREKNKEVEREVK